MLKGKKTTMKCLFVSIVMLLTVTACTTTHEIIIDEKGVNMSRYADDLAECEVYAEQVAVGEKVVNGTVSGAVVGGAIGAVGHHGDAVEGAAVGAISGGVKGLDEGERGQVRVVKNCLYGRGYRVLN